MSTDDLDLDLELESLGPAPASQRKSRPRAGDAALALAIGLLRAGPVLLGGLLVGAVLYILIGMAVVYHIDDDMQWRPPITAQAGSEAVSVASGLIGRELEENGWTPNDPPFYPGWWLDNMPNFQAGILYAVRRFTDQMVLNIGRNRGSSVEDEDLRKAADNLIVDPTRWIYNDLTRIVPQQPAERHYLDAKAALERYNARIANDEAFFDPRTDNLIDVLALVRNDLGAAAAAIDAWLRGDSSLSSDAEKPDYEVYYRNKGRLYGYYMILGGIERDFGEVIDGRDVRQVWDEMMLNLAMAAELQPFMTLTGALDGLVLPNHLAGQGFYALNARIKVAEIMDILAK